MSDLAASRTGTRWLIVTLAAGALLIAVVAAVLVHMGSFDVAADKPHSQPVFWLMNTVRERSVAIRAADITVPGDLADAKRIASGAAQYDEMCSLCHLAPGMKRTEISRGLVKMTGMPAWGVTHNDELLWDVVAFLRKLPELTADQYQTLVKSGPKSHDEMMHEMKMDDGQDHDDQPKQ